MHVIPQAPHMWVDRSILSFIRSGPTSLWPEGGKLGAPSHPDSSNDLVTERIWERRGVWEPEGGQEVPQEEGRELGNGDLNSWSQGLGEQALSQLLGTSCGQRRGLPHLAFLPPASEDCEFWQLGVDSWLSRTSGRSHCLSASVSPCVK